MKGTRGAANAIIPRKMKKKKKPQRQHSEKKRKEPGMLFGTILFFRSFKPKNQPVLSWASARKAHWRDRFYNGFF
jgi:hypothetical protein